MDPETSLIVSALLPQPRGPWIRLFAVLQSVTLSILQRRQLLLLFVDAT